MAVRKKATTEAESDTLPEQITPRRLYRSETNRVIAGVCGGLGEYFSTDPTMVRLVFVLLTIFSGTGLPLYLALWLIIPGESQREIISEKTIRRNADEMRSTAQNIGQTFRSPKVAAERRRWLGIAVILFGFIFFLGNFGFYGIDFGRLWPVWLIAGGILLLTFK